MYKASIIIPYFKKKKFFKKTINSVLNQTYKNFEIIIVYDDEDKRDLYFIKQLMKNDKRFRLIVNKKNLGAGESRNKGIKMAKGKYICFIDADDVWKNNKLEIQINFMRKKKVLISHSSYQIINERNKVIGHRIAENYDSYNEPKSYNKVTGWDKISENLCIDLLDNRPKDITNVRARIKRILNDAGIPLAYLVEERVVIPKSNIDGKYKCLGYLRFDSHNTARMKYDLILQNQKCKFRVSFSRPNSSFK